MARTITLLQESDTMRLGAALARIAEKGDVIALHGGLGMGKTTLARGFIRELCGPNIDVPSPTYTLVQFYKADKFAIWHCDLYRIQSEDELVELGLDESSDGVVLMEWPDKAGDELPKWRLDVSIAPDDTGRKVTLTEQGAGWKHRIAHVAKQFEI